MSSSAPVQTDNPPINPDYPMHDGQWLAIWARDMAAEQHDRKMRDIEDRQSLSEKQQSQSGSAGSSAESGGGDSFDSTDDGEAETDADVTSPASDASTQDSRYALITWLHV